MNMSFGTTLSIGRKNERGVTALITVIFSALLLSVITVSFIAVMVKEQEQASDDEISQSAYDSAMAGVEDAKRVIMACRANGGTGAACDAINNQQCNTVAAAGVTGNPTDMETLIQSSTTLNGGAALNQAYTCVKIAMNTPDYTLTNTEVAPGVSQVVPLKGVSSFNTVKIEWQLDSDSNGAVVPLSTVGRCSTLPTTLDLCNTSQWGSYPALIRLQAITPNASFMLSDLDKKTATATTFLYPTSLNNSVDLTLTDRFAEGNGENGVLANAPSRATCAGGLATYKCSSLVKLPRSVDAGSSVSFLRLTAFYRNASVRLSLYSDSTPVDFNGVQPGVDSTGRAGDIFRRVYARLSLADQSSYPEYAVELNDGALCKNFSITTNPANASDINGSSCTP